MSKKIRPKKLIIKHLKTQNTSYFLIWPVQNACKCPCTAPYPPAIFASSFFQTLIHLLNKNNYYATLVHLPATPNWPFEHSWGMEYSFSSRKKQSWNYYWNRSTVNLAPVSIIKLPTPTATETHRHCPRGFKPPKRATQPDPSRNKNEPFSYRTTVFFQFNLVVILLLAALKIHQLTVTFRAP